MKQFHDLQVKMLENFERLHSTYGTAFQTDTDKEDLWRIYLESFPANRNPIYRVRREFDCSCCRHFIKNIGGIVLIDDEQNVHTLWGFEIDDPDFQIVLDKLDEYVKSRIITDVYITMDAAVGTKSSHEADNGGNVTTWEHFYVPTV